MKFLFRIFIFDLPGDLFPPLFVRTYVRSFVRSFDLFDGIKLYFFAYFIRFFCVLVLMRFFLSFVLVNFRFRMNVVLVFVFLS